MAIVISKKICDGKPRIEGTRLTVEGVVSALSYGKSTDQIVNTARRAGIKISKKDVLDSLAFCARRASDGEKTTLKFS